MSECLNCGKNSQEVPLLRLGYKDGSYSICASCLPTLIHKPQNLAGKLPHAEDLKPGSAD